MALKEPPSDVAHVQVHAHVKCGGDPGRLRIARCFGVLLDAGEVLCFGQQARVIFPLWAGLRRG